MSKRVKLNYLKTAPCLSLGLLSFCILTLLSFAGHDIIYSNATHVNSNVVVFQEQVTALEDNKEGDQKSGKKKEPESNTLEDDKKSSVSTLTFNFVYYLIYKFKPADLP